MSSANIIEIKGICKSFPGVNALKDVSFSVEKGHVHALVGENGAGKSTLIKILAGVYAQDSGEVWFEGKSVSFKAPEDAIRAGINVVHQELKQVPPLSIAENIFLGKPMMTNTLGIPRVDWRAVYKSAQDLVDALGVVLDVRQSVDKLSVAQKQITEICRSISNQCKLIIMDEPSATLTQNELKVLFSIIKKLKQDNVSVIYISHRLEEIFEIADEVTVLRDGMHISTDDVANMDKNKLITLMVGRELTKEYIKDGSATDEVVLEVRNLTRRGMLKDINFKLRRGEILGIAGLVGSGRTELARAVLGIDRIDSGEILLKGKPQKLKCFTDAIGQKMALVPEDRRGQGLITEMTVRENISIVGIRKLIKAMAVRRRSEEEVAQNYVKMLSIMTPGIETTIKNLSGGNQQKVVLSKWLYIDPEIMILDEPTRGIDVGAKAEIYKILNDLTNKGVSVIMISSELPEILGMSDRILVMHDGQIKGEFSRDEATQEQIMRCCVS